MAKRNRKTLAGIILLVGPTALIIATFLLYAVVNWIIAGAPLPQQPASCAEGSQVLTLSDRSDTTQIEDCSQELSGNNSMLVTVVNIIFFLIGAVGVLSWLPGLVIGIVLLTTRK